MPDVDAAPAASRDGSGGRSGGRSARADAGPQPRGTEPAPRWWLRALAVAVAARCVSAVVLVLVARTQAPTPWTPASPSYLQYVGLMWDASWYRGIAEGGYPDELPLDDDGRVRQNAWAFFPLVPVLVRPALALGVPWTVAAPVLTTLMGLAAMVLVQRLVTEVTGRPGLALASVAVLAAYPASPVLQVAYTESAALLLVCAGLLALVRRRPWLAVPAVLALGLTRAVAPAFVVPVVATALLRWRAVRRGEDTWRRGERAGLAALTGTSVVAGLLWPALTGWVTGRPDAYTATQAAWRGRGDVVPVVAWFDVAGWLVGDLGPVLAVALLGLLAVLVLLPGLRRLGPELWGWTAGYVGYLVVVLEPWTSTVRFGLLAFPLATVLAAAVLRARAGWVRVVALTAVLAVGVAGQVAWVGLLWRLVPPSGWPP